MTGNKQNGQRWKRILLITAGSLLGLFFLYLAFRGISWQEFVAGVMQMQPIYLIPSTILLVLIQLVRALRFGVILSPFCTLGTKALWDVLNVWGAANMVMPARLAEFVRPYLLQRRGASFSSSFGAVMVERFFDLTGLLLLLAVILWSTPNVPRHYAVLGEVLLVALALGYVLVLVTLFRRDTVQSIVTKGLSVLPRRAAEFFDGIFRRLVDGLSVMASVKQVFIIFLYTMLLWTLFSTVTYMFLLAFSIQAPFLVAVTIQVLLCFGVALPSAPGFVGTFHAAGRYALALFGIQAVVAVSFATVYHLFSLVGCLVLGGLSYLTSDFRFDRGILTTPVESSGTNAAPGVASD